MSEQPKPLTLITPEDVERLNEAMRPLVEQARRALQQFGQAYAEALPHLREKLAAIDASDFELRT